MNHPKLIVLGLLSGGLKYGLEMEKFIKLTRMRLWARIGTSTIYKTLLDLQKAGGVSAKPEVAARGPGKMVYGLTKKGRTDFERLIDEALKSEESVYSDRIAGMVFALSLSPEKAQAKLTESIKGMDFALLEVEKEKEIQATHPMAQIVLNFYATVITAEKKAMQQAKALTKKGG